ncbi:uncharacterized protein [Montipora capricornis]|uniref:uncharacterized protein n=1 Tax=Montipora capricornis TaxID=246305 RepID=UPI0035F193FF
MDIRTYIDLGSSDETWYCSNCTFLFNFADTFLEESTTGDINASLQSSLSGSTDCVRYIFTKVLFLNARSIRNKVFDLQALLFMDSFDVVVIVETWLDRKYQDFELKLEGYNIFRKDRCNRRGGGVLIAVRNHISCIHRSDLEVKLEMIALEIRPNPTICVLLSAFYRLPDADELFLSQLREFLVKYSRTGLSNLVVTGDFNFPHIDWNLGCPTKPDPETEDLCNILDDFFLVQKNLHATRDLRNSGPSGNILDLVLTNNDILVEDVVVHPRAFDSDHHSITFKFHAEMRRPKNIQGKVYCYKKVDFKDSVDVNSPTTDVVNPNLLLNVTTTAFEVQGILRRFDIHKSPGVDNIPSRILQICAKKLSVPLSHLFNLSLRSGVMPTLWKSANITPIHKTNNKEFVENYRSISLLPIPAKCLERLVHTAIYAYVSPYLAEWQHGFVKGKSCETQLVLTHPQWVTALDEGRQVDIAFLDFSKAFDRVNHSILPRKLCGFGISGSLLQWCERYLSNRWQRTVLDGVSSTWLEVPSGVPQGSILGSLSFLVFISELPDVVLPGNTIALFADDCKISRVIDDASDQCCFQRDLDNLHQWSIRNAMVFNVKK